jgi:hypothetical protein
VTGLIILLAIMTVMIVVGAAASRFGVDSRETIDEPHRPTLFA